MLWKLLLTCRALIVLDSCDIAQAGQLELGVGKAINNTNTKLPAYAYSIHATQAVSDNWNVDIGYTRFGKSQLAENAAVTTETWYMTTELIRLGWGSLQAQATAQRYGGIRTCLINTAGLRDVVFDMRMMEGTSAELVIYAAEC